MLTTAPDPQVGPLLRHWRAACRMSQLDLALEANVSARHVSFVETGRAQPSRQMVLALAQVLDLPSRERNALLLSAGYAPLYRETGLDTPAMAGMRRALALILRQQDPFPTVALDRTWHVVMTNAAWARVAALGGAGDLAPYTVLPAPRPNILRMLFDPRGLRPLVANWEAVARVMLQRARHEATGDPESAALLDELCAMPGVPVGWREPDRDTQQGGGLIVPVTLHLGDTVAQLFSTITTLGTAQDITLQELHIESFFPADAATEQFLRALGE